MYCYKSNFNDIIVFNLKSKTKQPCFHKRLLKTYFPLDALTAVSSTAVPNLSLSTFHVHSLGSLLLPLPSNYVRILKQTYQVAQRMQLKMKGLFVFVNKKEGRRRLFLITRFMLGPRFICAHIKGKMWPRCRQG